MKKLAKTVSIFVAIIIPFVGLCQNEISKELTSLVGSPLETAQNELQSQGFEIASSSLFKKNQLWYKESEKVCVRIGFSKKGNKPVKTVEPGDEQECIKGVAAARKVWENYHDGQCDVSSGPIEEEREKLRKGGYQASYWIHDVSPGKTMEVWINESKQVSKSIVWDDASKKEIKVMDRDYKYAKNPSPLKE